jgi:hypothetical protein
MDDSLATELAVGALGLTLGLNSDIQPPYIEYPTPTQKTNVKKRGKELGIKDYQNRSSKKTETELEDYFNEIVKTDEADETDKLIQKYIYVKNWHYNKIINKTNKIIETNPNFTNNGTGKLIIDHFLNKIGKVGSRSFKNSGIRLLQLIANTGLGVALASAGVLAGVFSIGSVGAGVGLGAAAGAAVGLSAVSAVGDLYPGIKAGHFVGNTIINAGVSGATNMFKNVYSNTIATGESINAKAGNQIRANNESYENSVKELDTVFKQFQDNINNYDAIMNPFYEAYEFSYDNAKYTTTLAHLFALFKEDQDERNYQMGIALFIVIISIAAAIYIETQPYYIFCFKIQDKNDQSSIAVRSFIRENYEGDFFKHFPDQKRGYAMIKYNYFRMQSIRDLVETSFKNSPNDLLSRLKPQGGQGASGTIYRYREMEESKKTDTAELQYVYRANFAAIELFENEVLELNDNKEVYCYYMISESDLISKLGETDTIDESDFIFRTMSRKISSTEIEGLYAKYYE